MSYRTEQEQIEIFTQWWKKHGRLTLSAALLVLVAYIGWTQWQSYRHTRAEEASVLYDDLLRLSESDSSEAQALALRLRNEYDETFYGQAALLFLAEFAVAQNDLAGASAHLDDLIKHDVVDDLGYTARLRSAKILHALGKDEEALLRLKEPVPAGFDVLFAELRGNIYMTLNQPEKARTAYQQAMDAVEKNISGETEILEMKLSQAGGAP